MLLYVFLIISHTFAEDFESLITENLEGSGSDVEVVSQSDVEDVVPVVGSVNFSGHARASGKVTIVGSTEPTTFDNPWGVPISVEKLLPDYDEDIIYFDYPDPSYPYFDYGIPPYFQPTIGPSYRVPSFAPTPYSAPMFAPTPTMTHPHFIEIIEPSIGPTTMQPQFVEIFEPTMGPSLTHPHFIEIVEPHYGNQPIFQPYTNLDLPLELLYPSYPYYPHADLEMVPVIVEFDVLDSMHGQMLDEPGYYIANDVGRTPIKRDTQYVPVSGKINIVGKF